MQPFVILHHDSEWHPDELTAIVDADNERDALEMVRAYISTGDDDFPGDYRAEPLANWRYNRARNAVGPFDL